MRLVSVTYLNGKPDLLARWTTGGMRAHWRFPAARLEELRTTFEMSQAEVDELMLARIEELETDAETRALVQWLVDYMSRQLLTEEESALLAAWRVVRDRRPLGLQAGRRTVQELEKQLDDLLKLHEQRQEAERAAEPVEEEMTAAERSSSNRRMEGLKAKYLALPRNRRAKTLTPRGEMLQLLARLRGAPRSR